MKLIVGLGNPGKEYEKTRHNVGFMVLDYLASKMNVTFKMDLSLKGFIATINVGKEKVIFLKPTTYMNLSGESVIATKQYYKISDEDIIIISDDLDSPLGRIRVREKGSAGGHNGHKSIIRHLGTDVYKRIKIGIGRSEILSAADYVLQNFTEGELAVINQAKEAVALACVDFMEDIEFLKIASKYSESI